MKRDEKRDLIRCKLKRVVRKNNFRNSPTFHEELALFSAQEEISHAMKVEDVGKRQLAEMLGVRPWDITRILSSGGGLSIRRLGRIMHVLGYEIRFHARKIAPPA